jgi:two-component system, NtrC family, response regulator GlrR
MQSFEELHLVGRAPAFLDSLRLIRRFAESDLTVLVLGETGTGKELAARAIHYLGRRRDRPFVPINCGAIPDSLVENELFGHARGAFTDGREGAPGLIADAEGGTLFLDEVETLSPKAQVALLRFLQDGIYRPLGARVPVKGNVHVVAASNLDLAALVEKGEFRRDLMYRLQIGALRMPPLRERRSDIAVLAQHFVRKLCRQYGRPERSLDAAALAVLERHDWPGNVRELENVIHRQFVLSDSTVMPIDEACLRASGDPPPAPEAAVPYEIGFRRAKERVIEAFERDYVRWALEETGGNVSAAARRSEKERRTFGKLLKKYGIDRRSYAPR